MNSKKKRQVYPYVLVLPALFAIVVILLYPMATGLYLSFHQYKLTKPVDVLPFIGFSNYISLFKDRVFYISILKTFYWVVFSVGFQALLGLGVALVLNQKFKGRALVRGIVLVPWVMPTVVAGLIWAWIYDGSFGVLNDVLKRMSLIKENIQWLGNKSLALPSLIFTNIWKGYPFFAISILAGLQAIPKELYEAAEIDGASVWQRFIHITLTQLKNVIFITTMLRIIWTTNTTDLIFTMTKGGPGYSSHVLALYSYLTAWSKLDFGYSSALAITLLVVMLIIISIYMKMSYKDESL
ncbi:MAG: Inner membrane ABC transporter permease protein YcjO [Spirochaetes bacterium ADurb.Bin315]|jgi:multiple sugar transport system permease protein|nr:MAG: Inner membrane ABC transporter permease protein YcjO [Spirochaetes bacterium ADurb.Bin315]